MSEQQKHTSLLPCPFCGEDDHLYPAYHGMGDGEPYAIDCLRCGIDFVPRKGKDVFEAWNERALHTHDELVEALEKTSAVLNTLVKNNRDRFWEQISFTFTGKCEHLGAATIGDVLDNSDSILSRAKGESHG